LYPAGTVVEAATTPSRWDVSGKRRKRSNRQQFAETKYPIKQFETI